MEFGRMVRLFVNQECAVASHAHVTQEQHQALLVERCDVFFAQNFCNSRRKTAQCFCWNCSGLAADHGAVHCRRVEPDRLDLAEAGLEVVDTWTDPGGDYLLTLARSR
jgi:hypothetical protein